MRGTRPARAPGPVRTTRRAPGPRSALLAEVLGFAAAGLCAYATDLALFVWLRGRVGVGPLPAKALSFVAACTVAYAGNVLGPYRRCPAPGPSRLRSFGLFAAVNLAGAVVQLLCLVLTHYGLGLTSPWADTVSGAGAGMALATVLRFWATRTFVFGVPAPARGRTGGTP